MDIRHVEPTQTYFIEQLQSLNLKVSSLQQHLRLGQVYCAETEEFSIKQFGDLFLFQYRFKLRPPPPRALMDAVSDGLKEFLCSAQQRHIGRLNIYLCKQRCVDTPMDVYRVFQSVFHRVKYQIDFESANINICCIIESVLRMFMFHHLSARFYAI